MNVRERVRVNVCETERGRNVFECERAGVCERDREREGM